MTRDRFEWPGPGQPSCGDEAEDRSTRRRLYCCLVWNHESLEHFWQERQDEALLSASWIKTGPITFIGTSQRD